VDLAQVARVLASFTALFTAVQVVPLIVAMTEAPHAHVRPLTGFGWGIGIGAAVAALLWLAGRRAQGRLFRKETIAIAGFSCVVGAIPLQWSGLLPDGIDAVFESVSGLTTCGGTVLGSAGLPTPEDTPESLLLWRALLQWVGGLGIVLLFALLLGGSQGRHLLTAESVAIQLDPDQPRAISHARLVTLVYCGLTAACTLALMLAGLRLLDAVCHAFTTLATGGFSTRTSIASFHNLAVEIVLTFFMYVGGCSFAAIGALARGGLRAEGGLLRSEEFRLYTAITVLAVGLVTLNLAGAGVPFGSALRMASFNVVSTLSCCGYATADFQAWPSLSIVVLIACLLVGGCSGSAAGGFKQVRLLVTLKLLGFTLRQFVRPRSVERLKFGGEPMPAAAVSSMLAVVLCWVLAVLVGTAILACDDRLGFLGALSTSASMQANAGPAIASVDPASVPAALFQQGVAAATLGPNIGPFGGYGELHGWAKLWMCLQMVLGRLELLTLLALVSPSFWRR
jgi:trk system potassium uptake protein TrkH